MEQVLVSGSAGFIGHHLVRALKKRGYHVIGVDNLSGGNENYAAEASEFKCCDIGDLVASDLKDIKYVFHLAALPRVPYSIEHPRRTHNANVDETLDVLIASRDAGVKKFIYSSSSSVYGGNETFPTPEDVALKPLSPYAIQKLASEMYAENFRTIYGLQTASLRYFNVFGEEQDASNPYTGVITKFLELAKQGKSLTIYGDGEQRRDFTYVQDVVEANILLAESENVGVFNCGTGVNTSVNEIAHAISNNIEYQKARKGDPLISLANNSKLKSIGWNPTTDVASWLE